MSSGDKPYGGNKAEETRENNKGMNSYSVSRASPFDAKNVLSLSSHRVSGPGMDSRDGRIDTDVGDVD